jgi:hypothetical protein
MPEIVVGQSFKGLDGLDERGRKLALGWHGRRDSVEKLGFQAAVTPLGSLPEALVESFREMKGDGMGAHGEDSCATV